MVFYEKMQASMPEGYNLVTFSILTSENGIFIKIAFIRYYLDDLFLDFLVIKAKRSNTKLCRLIVD